MYYKNGRIVNSLPNKLELDGKTIFNPKWHHYEAGGWKEFPSNLLSVDRKFIKWVNGDPVEMSQEEKDTILSLLFEQNKKENEEEKKLIAKKAKDFNFLNMSDYIRFVCLNTTKVIAKND